MPPTDHSIWSWFTKLGIQMMQNKSIIFSIVADWNTFPNEQNPLYIFCSVYQDYFKA